jgi:hypothetical protein
MRALSNGGGLTGAIGVGVAAAGCGLVAVGLWGRREVARSLARERIEGVDQGPVTSAAAARELAEFIRANTLEATGGRTYSEVAAYAGEDGPTADRAAALVDERTGGALENPDHDLWLQSTTLQTALMQAYVSARLAELTAGLGALFVAAGAGLAASARLSRG